MEDFHSPRALSIAFFFVNGLDWHMYVVELGGLSVCSILDLRILGLWAT